MMARGKGDEARGRMEKAVGDLTDDPEFSRRGQSDEATGKTKDAVDRRIDSVRGTK